MLGTFEHFMLLHRKGLRLVPLVGKAALLKDWPELHLGESDIRYWSNRGVNWGIITGEPLMVLDTDSEAAEAWVKAKGIESTVVVQSGGGGLHRYFHCPDGIEVRSRSGAHKIKGLDVKGWRSYIVAAGSIHPTTGKRYEYLAGKELGELHNLPIFDPSWMREPRRTIAPLDSSGRKSAVSGRIRNIRAYIRGIRSEEHQGGDRACFTVACLLVEAGFTYPEIVAELEAWNQECAFPPWKPEALERKASYAMARVLGRSVM